MANPHSLTAQYQAAPALEYLPSTEQHSPTPHRRLTAMGSSLRRLLLNPRATAKLHIEEHVPPSSTTNYQQEAPPSTNTSHSGANVHARVAPRPPDHLGTHPTHHNHHHQHHQNNRGSARVHTLHDMPDLDVDITTSTFQPTYFPQRWDIYMLGITIGIGGQYFSWNNGLLASGLYSYIIEFFLVGFAYVCLCCCTSEITGALPFAGGAYGLSRCTLGYYPGFLIGCCEALEYIVYVATSVTSLAKMVVESIPSLQGYQPIIWLAFYMSALVFHIRGGAPFWRWNFFIGTCSFVLVAIYVFGSLPHVDFANHADNDPKFRFINGAAGFMKALPLTCWFFVGVEAINLASDDVVQPERIIPFAQLSCIFTLFGTGMFVFFVTVALPPPGLNQVSKLLAPFDNGFELLFGIHHQTATLFSIPATYATTFGFMWGYGKLIAAMANSRLLPPVLATTSEKYGTPYAALLFGAVLSYGMCLIVHFVPNIDNYLFNVCITAAFMGYAGQCIGYIALNKLYPMIHDDSTSFRSPFGIYGAVYSLFIWALGLISIIGFQDRNGLEFAIFVAIVLLLTVFYHVYAKERQTFSPQENKVFLVAHIMKFNVRARKLGIRAQQQTVKHADPPVPLDDEVLEHDDDLLPLETIAAVAAASHDSACTKFLKWLTCQSSNEPKKRKVLKPPPQVLAIREQQKQLQDDTNNRIAWGSANFDKHDTLQNATKVPDVPRLNIPPTTPTNQTTTQTNASTRKLSPFHQYLSQRALLPTDRPQTATSATTKAEHGPSLEPPKPSASVAIDTGTKGLGQDEAMSSTTPAVHAAEPEIDKTVVTLVKDDDFFDDDEEDITKEFH